jgi:hypothetical protein
VVTTKRLEVSTFTYQKEFGLDGKFKQGCLLGPYPVANRGMCETIKARHTQRPEAKDD